MSSILKEIRAFESGFYVTNTQNSPHRRSTAAFHVGSSEATHNTNAHTDGKWNVSCIYCKEHTPHTCEAVTDYQRRLDIVKKGNICYNCLAYLKVSQWTSRFRCKKCRRKDHTSLCSGESPKNSSSNNKQTTPEYIQDPSQVSANNAPASTHKPQAFTTCSLKTAIATVSAGNIKTSTNILFDEEAQRSFITAQLAAELQIIPIASEQVALSSFGARLQSYQKLGVTTIQVQTNVGEIIPITVLIVPSITVYTYPELILCFH